MKRLAAIPAAVLFAAAAALYAFRSRGDPKEIELSGTVETREIQVAATVARSFTTATLSRQGWRRATRA